MPLIRESSVDEKCMLIRFLTLGDKSHWEPNKQWQNLLIGRTRGGYVVRHLPSNLEVVGQTLTRAVSF